MKKQIIYILIVFLFISASCVQSPESPSEGDSPRTGPARILINEVYTGAEGANQADFIELFNAGTEIADLEGYSLWYQLKDGDQEILIHTWDETTLIPPLGFYALSQAGQEFAVSADLEINQSLIPNRGGLSLKIGDQIEDQLCWGTGPEDLAERRTAPPMTPGSSLIRVLDPETNLPLDTNNNQDDFIISSAPELQNTGSLLQHPDGAGLVFNFDFPELIKPGELFEVAYEITNLTGSELKGLQLFLPLPETIYLQDETSEFQIEGNQVIATFPNLGLDEVYSGVIPLEGDITFSEFTLRNVYLQAENFPLPAFVGPVDSEIGGGAIPIATARELIDQEVVIEGTSTMYVGGFYAGSGAKFYVEDDSAGIQVYVAEAGNSLIVPLGSSVRVRGTITIYRDSIELIPSSEDFVEILEPGSDENLKPPVEVQIAEINTSPENLPGNLIAVEGRVARIEEFSYSYEIDLFDDIGNLVNVYIDKGTGISIEEIEADQKYRIIGIMEVLDGNLRLYPRLQSDLIRVYEPGLAVQVYPPTTVEPGEPFEVVYTLINHSPEPDQNLVVSARVDPDLEILEVQEEGRFTGTRIIWDRSRLAGNEVIDFSFLAQFSEDIEYVSFDDYLAISSSWPTSTYGTTSYTFSGDSIPIWAVQGPGLRSPYILTTLSTEGVVTGVFPELEGFWIQEKESDDNSNTSPGLFVSSGPTLPEISVGDVVSVIGRVRESFSQTEIEINSPADVEVLGRTTLPDPAPLDPPVNNEESVLYYESLEGCLVEVPDWAVVVGPTTRYGEFVVVLEETGITRSWRNQNYGNLIHIDDGSSIIHNYADTLPYALNVGDKVLYLEGPLAYTYGNYKIEPTEEYIARTQDRELDPLPDLKEGYISFMTWNVENLFDFVVPHPSSPPLPKVSEYKRDITKVALTIEAAGFPTVIGFQEVENLEILEDIAEEPILTEFEYQAVLIEGDDSRGIDVGYLVRGDQAVVLDQVQYPAPGNITSRPPLLIKITVGDSNEVIYILNNHFTSMSGGEEATEPRRNAQAAWNVEIANELLAEDPDAYLVVMGDLNSYNDSLPIQTLKESGLINLFDRLEPNQRYTYIYEGTSQVLDYILVSDSLLNLLISFDVLHSNADYALPDSDDTSLFHISDHDPVIATFVLP
jgi:predicted extracellular nuclease